MNSLYYYLLTRGRLNVVYHVCLVENTAKFKFICGCLHAIYALSTLSCFTRIRYK